MKKLLVLVPVVLFLVGCGGGEKDYFPIAVGNVWNYQSTSTTKMPDTTITTVDTTKVEVTGETTLNNGTKVFEVVAKGKQYADTSYFEKTDDYIFVYEDKSSTTPDTAFVLPLEENKSWNVHKDTSYTETRKIITKESVTVPAGTYDDCWKVMDIFTDGTIAETSYVWLAPDVGQVKMTFTEQDTNFTVDVKLELLNATIK
jgi:hypothetical protein|uniref:DUF3108 domain-containing protein n=1 Tax=candidate division WOR-3 bacterium TaxID=2052148 RepID=A0A7V3RIE9_UNCW3